MKQRHFCTRLRIAQCHCDANLRGARTKTISVELHNFMKLFKGWNVHASVWVVIQQILVHVVPLKAKLLFGGLVSWRFTPWFLLAVAIDLHPCTFWELRCHTNIASGWNRTLPFAEVKSSRRICPIKRGWVSIGQAQPFVACNQPMHCQKIRELCLCGDAHKMFALGTVTQSLRLLPCYFLGHIFNAGITVLERVSVRTLWEQLREIVDDVHLTCVVSADVAVTTLPFPILCPAQIDAITCNKNNQWEHFWKLLHSSCLAVYRAGHKSVQFLCFSWRRNMSLARTRSLHQRRGRAAILGGELGWGMLCCPRWQWHKGDDGSVTQIHRSVFKKIDVLRTGIWVGAPILKPWTVERLGVPRQAASRVVQSNVHVLWHEVPGLSFVLEKLLHFRCGHRCQVTVPTGVADLLSIYVRLLVKTVRSVALVTELKKAIRTPKQR